MLFELHLGQCIAPVLKDTSLFYHYYPSLPKIFAVIIVNDEQFFYQCKSRVDRTQEAFTGFRQRNSGHGGYIGTMQVVTHQENHLIAKLETELKAINTRLKSARVNVSIRKSGKSLQLRSTLPIKPGDFDKNGIGTKQYDISLGIPFNFHGLQTAEEEAYELGKLIARKQFQWNEKYLGKTHNKVRKKTIGDLIADFEVNYFQTRKRTLKSENTFSSYFYIAQKHLPKDKLAIDINFITAVKLCNSSDSVKNELIKVIRVLCKCSGLEVPELSNLKIKPTAQRHRDIPRDVDIEQEYLKFETYSINRPSKLLTREDRNNWKLWRWVYGMLATYGLRPREIFVNPDLDWWLSSDNIMNTWRVNQECKTGEREALPLYPQWVETFNLKADTEAIELLKAKIQGKVTNKQINSARHGTDRWFRFVGIPFQPYDLRHAWAIRAHLMGIPIKAAADNLGHSVNMHTSIYQRWFSLENRKVAIAQAINKKSQMEDLQDIVIKLEHENEKLRIENERLRLKMKNQELIRIIN
ncbi:integrase [Umezakia ovalisporum]|uniref:Integrase n=1 Tax=Umezakia ovalisporum FSS-43 TaxID=2740520 RepID=A0ABT6K6J4_9CYAN|nr:integrase [Umezakia ovalisporum]MDH6057615.1 integrase [Umezakia ovalisporum FSS-43]MDH6072423.1 integrase [Umezakia ovalisporum CobakiLakeA]MDH6082216.1 integrase [Umezakia ovalisporum FSS-44]